MKSRCSYGDVCYEVDLEIEHERGRTDSGVLLFIEGAFAVR